MGYINGLLYVGNSNQIKVLKVDETDFDNEDELRPIIPDESQISTIVPDGHKIHGFFIN